MTVTSNLDSILESVETLPPEDQEMLIDLIRRRYIQRRRAEIAANIVSSREQYKAGQVRCLSVEEVVAEFDK